MRRWPIPNPQMREVTVDPVEIADEVEFPDPDLLDEARIVEDLARSPEPTFGGNSGEDLFCALCMVDLPGAPILSRDPVVWGEPDPVNHEESCPWRRARLWLAGFPTG